MPPDLPELAQPRLRLSLLTTFGEPCGIATYSEALAEGLARHGVEVSVVAPKLRKSDAPRGPQPERIWSRSRAGLVEARRAFQLILRQRADVVHAQVTLGIVSPTFLIAVARWCRRARIPFFVTLHESGGGSLMQRLRFAALLRGLGGAELIVHSADPELPGARVIPHGIGEVPYRPREEARTELGIAQSALVIAHFGFIHPDKGIEAVLEAVAELRAARFPELEYRICGGVFSNPASRAHLEHLRERARALGLGDAVSLSGEFLSEERVTLEMQAADLVVLNYLTGNRQGASGAAHRALATGAALLVSRAPIFDNLREAARSLSGPLTTELGALLASPAARGAIAARAQAFCDARRWVRVAGTHAELYRRALKTPA